MIHNLSGPNDNDLNDINQTQWIAMIFDPKENNEL